MRKLLYLDVDNTICNSTKRFVEIYNKEYNQQADWTKCYNWDYSDICPLLENAEDIFARADFYNGRLELMDEYVALVISLLHLQGYDIHFVTIGTKDNLKYKKRWLEQIFPHIKKSNYHFLEKTEMGKEEIHMQDGILVDDNYINLLTSNSDLKICMHKPVGWNKDVERSGFIRLNNSLELYDFIRKLEREGVIIG